MYKEIKHFIGINLINLQGWRTNRKILIFESDDWGTIRMPSIADRDFLCARYPTNFNISTYDRVDNLASSVDLEALFEVLSKYHDSKGNSPVITANTIVGNPDFERISDSGFSDYFFEPFTKTLEGYSHEHQNAIQVWKQGMRAGIFHPQLHGREHLNVIRWMKLLQAREVSSLEAFKRRTWVMRSDLGKRLDVAFDIKKSVQLTDVRKYLEQAAVLFEEIFGYKSVSYIAPSYTWNNEIERFLKNIGVDVVQSGLFQILPEYNQDAGEKRRIRHYTGQINELRQVYLMRNVHFEPTLMRNIDLVSKCIADISCAFRLGRPAIVSVHRLNFIGNLEEENRSYTLRLLNSLLREILRKYPDIEFLTSDVLGQETLK